MPTDNKNNMALNYIWIGFFIAAFLVALFRTFRYYLHDFFAESVGLLYQLNVSDKEVFSDMVQATFNMAETSVKISIVLIGVMTLWLGIMKIGEKGGAVNYLSKGVQPFFKYIFPEIPKNHPAMGSVLMNFAANMLGLDNAATPFGIKAMEDLQTLNKKKDTASNAQIMFIVLNTSALTVIPIAIMAYRASYGAENPADIFIPILVTTFFSSLAGLIVVSVIQKINLFKPIVLLYLGVLTLGISLFVWYMRTLEQEQVQTITSLGGNFILFSIIIAFILLGILKKINIYETFIEGAKEGFHVAIKIIPYLVAMLVAIGVFRASGGLDLLIDLLGRFFAFLGLNTDFVPGLPTAFMKPLSGSGARGMMLEAFDHYGVDSFVGKLTSTFQGSTETTFYTIAVYFGAVGIRKTRYAVTCGLIADATAVVTAIIIAYIFFH